jgi:hypothetical protein
MTAPDRIAVQLDDLDQLVVDLRKLGIDSCHEFVYGPHGCVEGLDVGNDFFPLWELKLAANLDALRRLDFAAILARRHYGWSIEPPRAAVHTIEGER